jgi:hypothetical protein
LRRTDNYPGGIFGATEYKSIAEWAKLPSSLEAEDEQWFSFADLADTAKVAASI